MKKYILKSIVIVLSIIAFMSCDENETPSIYGDINVLIVDENQQPIIGAEITLGTLGKTPVLKRQSNSDGEVLFPEIIEGKELLVYPSDPTLYVPLSDIGVSVMAIAANTITETLAIGPPIVGDLELLVVDENNQIMTDFAVIIKGDGDIILTEQNTDEVGKIILTEVTGGEYTATPVDGRYLGSISFTVIPALLNTVTLSVEKIKHYATKFDKNGFLSTIELPPYGATYTISGMIKPTGDGVRTISGFGTLDGFSSFFRLENGYWNGGAPDNCLYLGQWSGEFKKVRSADPIENDVWSHIAVVVNENVVKFYINGVESTGPYPYGTAPMDNPITPDAFKFGALLQSSINFGESFKGSMNNLAIWNTARTAAEIAAEAASGLTGNEDGLWGYWNFDDNATTTADLSGSGNTLELGGGAVLYLIED